jgi:hypothetical protein
MIFTVESRYAQVISAIETAAGVLLLGVFAVWVFGLYPASVQFRVVGNADDSEVASLVRKRLLETPGSAVTLSNEQRLSIACWQYERERIAQQLMIADVPSLIVCTTKPAIDLESDSKKFLPSLSGSLPANLVQRTTGAGTEVQIEREIALENSWIASVQTNSSKGLTLTWSREGGSKLREILSAYPKKQTLALKIDGWLVAFGDERDDQDKAITMTWMKKDPSRTIRSVQSALRGPAFPFELEWLNP